MRRPCERRLGSLQGETLKTAVVARPVSMCLRERACTSGRQRIGVRSNPTCCSVQCFLLRRARGADVKRRRHVLAYAHLRDCQVRSRRVCMHMVSVLPRILSMQAQAHGLERFTSGLLTALIWFTCQRVMGFCCERHKNMCMGMGCSWASGNCKSAFREARPFVLTHARFCHTPLLLLSLRSTLSFYQQV